jgi:hypothetical protein
MEGEIRKLKKEVAGLRKKLAGSQNNRKEKQAPYHRTILGREAMSTIDRASRKMKGCTPAMVKMVEALVSADKATGYVGYQNHTVIAPGIPGSDDAWPYAAYHGEPFSYEQEHQVFISSTTGNGFIAFAPSAVAYNNFADGCIVTDTSYDGSATLKMSLNGNGAPRRRVVFPRAARSLPDKSSQYSSLIQGFTVEILGRSAPNLDRGGRIIVAESRLESFNGLGIGGLETQFSRVSMFDGAMLETAKNVRVQSTNLGFLNVARAGSASNSDWTGDAETGYLLIWFKGFELGETITIKVKACGLYMGRQIDSAFSLQWDLHGFICAQECVARVDGYDQQATYKRASTLKSEALGYASKALVSSTPSWLWTIASTVKDVGLSVLERALLG